MSVCVSFCMSVKAGSVFVNKLLTDSASLDMSLEAYRTHND